MDENTFEKLSSGWGPAHLEKRYEAFVSLSLTIVDFEIIHEAVIKSIIYTLH